MKSSANRGFSKNGDGYGERCPGGFLAAALLWFAIGQTNAGPTRFERLGALAGLSHQTVYAIHQDQQGYLWFCTQNGLNRYDGYRIKVYYYEPGNPRSLSSNNINSILEEKDGSMWLGTWGGGLNRFYPNEETFRQYGHDPENRDSIGSNFVQCLFLASDGRLWVGTYDAGLNRFDPISGTAVRYDNRTERAKTLSSNRIWGICEDGRGRLWLATDRGLNIFDPETETFQRFPSHDNAPIALETVGIRAIYPGRLNRIWVGTTEGLAVVDAESEKARYFVDEAHEGGGLGRLEINVIFEDREGDLWVGTHHEGLRRLDRETEGFESFRHDPGDPNSIGINDIRSLFEDRSQNLWIGTRGGGLTKLDLKPAKFRLFRHDPGAERSISYGSISAVVSGRKGTVWIGSRLDGLNRMDTGDRSVTHFRHRTGDPASLSDNQVIALEVDGDRSLWVGTVHGLNRFEGTTGGFERFFSDPENEATLAHNHVLSLCADRTGPLWVGTSDGLSLYDGKGFRNFRHVPGVNGGLGFGRIMTIYQDRSQTVWLGLAGGGLQRFDRKSERFGSFLHDPENPRSISSDTVLSICEYRDTLWVGTSGGGLNQMKDGAFRCFLIDDGLPDNTVYAIIPDSFGYLWLSTNKGLSRFDPQTSQFRNYDIYDGLQDNQFNAGAGHRTPEGELYFGGTHGLNAFFPSEVQDHYAPPMVVISGFRVMDREYAANLGDGERVVLPTRENFIAFEFAALDFTRPEKNRYAYKLEGVDPQWVQAGNRNFASYPNLAPGSYIFKVRAGNHDGIWNDFGTSATIVITPPFYQTGVAKTLYGLALILVAGGLVLGYLYRRRYREKVRDLELSEKLAVEANRTKNAFLANMSHELRTPLNAIIGYSEILAEDLEDYKSGRFDPGQGLADLSKIKSSAFYQLAQVNNLLELSRIDSGHCELFIEPFDLRQMVETVLNHIRPMLERSENRMEVSYHPNEIGRMTADQNKVEGILLNLLTNANKFTQKGVISLSVSRVQEREKPYIRFQVQDTGIGIEPEKIDTIFREFSTIDGVKPYEGPGLGLYITRHFSKLMGGHVGVESQVSRGSTFSVYLPAEVPPLTRTTAKGATEPEGEDGQPVYTRQTIF